jgi:hypothetical protein
MHPFSLTEVEIQQVSGAAPDYPSTMAIGEEGGDIDMAIAKKGGYTTMAIGEEGGFPPAL